MGRSSLTTSAERARAALGIRLRDIRKDAGLAGIELAARAGWPPSKVSKIEHGKQTPAEKDLKAWCGHCLATRELPGLIAAARSIAAQSAGQRRLLRDTTRRRQDASGAARMWRIYEPKVVPGLLQTREYAVTVLRTVIDFTRAPQDPEARADERIERQRILEHRDRRCHVLLGEAALLTDVGGSGVMTAQLEHLLAVSSMPCLRLGVIPAGAPYRVPPSSGFWIFGEALVEVETYTGELSLSRPEEIDLYGRAFERLAALAVYDAEARETVAGALGQLKAGKSRRRPGSSVRTPSSGNAASPA